MPISTAITHVSTDKAPKAIGPYSQAVVHTGPVVYISGQIPLHPQTGEVVGNNASQQAKQVCCCHSSIPGVVGGNFRSCEVNTPPMIVTFL